MNYKEIQQLLEKEINYCEKSSSSRESADFERGFLKGLKQANLMIKTYSETKKPLTKLSMFGSPEDSKKY